MAIDENGAFYLGSLPACEIHRGMDLAVKPCLFTVGNFRWKCLRFSEGQFPSCRLARETSGQVAGHQMWRRSRQS